MDIVFKRFRCLEKVTQKHFGSVSLKFAECIDYTKAKMLLCHLAVFPELLAIPPYYELFPVNPWMATDQTELLLYVSIFNFILLT